MWMIELATNTMTDDSRTGSHNAVKPVIWTSWKYGSQNAGNHILSLAGDRHTNERIGSGGDELQRARQTGGGRADRQGNGGVTGDVEELGQAQHEVANRFVDAADLHLRLADRWRRNRQRRQHQRIVACQ